MSHLHSRGNKSQFVVRSLKSLLSLTLAFSLIIAMSGQLQETSAASVAAAASTADSGAAVLQQSVQEPAVDPVNDPKTIKNTENVPEAPEQIDPSDISQYKIRPDSLDLSEASARKRQGKLRHVVHSFHPDMKVDNFYDQIFTGVNFKIDRFRLQLARGGREFPWVRTQW